MSDESHIPPEYRYLCEAVCDDDDGWKIVRSMVNDARRRERVRILAHARKVLKPADYMALKAAIVVNKKRKKKS